MDKNLEIYVDTIMNEQEHRSGIFTNLFDVVIELFLTTDVGLTLEAHTRPVEVFFDGRLSFSVR